MLRGTKAPAEYQPVEVQTRLAMGSPDHGLCRNNTQLIGWFSYRACCISKIITDSESRTNIHPADETRWINKG